MKLGFLIHYNVIFVFVGYSFVGNWVFSLPLAIALQQQIAIENVGVSLHKDTNDVKNNDIKLAVDDALNTFSQNIQLYLCDKFKTLGITTWNTNKKIQTSVIQEKVNKLFDSYEGLGQIGQLRTMGFEICNNGVPIIAKIKSHVIGYVAQWDEIESNKDTIIYRFQYELEATIIPLYCDLVKKFQQLTGLTHSTLCFDDRIYPTEWFSEKFQTLKETIIEYARGKKLDEQKIQNIVGSLGAFEYTALFAKADNDIKNQVNVFCEDTKNRFKQLVDFEAV